MGRGRVGGTSGLNPLFAGDAAIFINISRRLGSDVIVN